MPLNLHHLVISYLPISTASGARSRTGSVPLPCPVLPTRKTEMENSGHAFSLHHFNALCLYLDAFRLIGKRPKPSRGVRLNTRRTFWYISDWMIWDWKINSRCNSVYVEKTDVGQIVYLCFGCCNFQNNEFVVNKAITSN